MSPFGNILLILTVGQVIRRQTMSDNLLCSATARLVEESGVGVEVLVVDMCPIEVTISEVLLRKQWSKNGASKLSE